MVNERMRATGGRMPVLATFTVRHSASDPIEICKRVRSQCWRKFVGGRKFKAWRERFDLEWIASEEVTRGEENGWHPHMHVLFMPGRDAGELLSEKPFVHSRWARLVERELGADNVPDWQHGTDLRYSDRADYLAKCGFDDDPTPFKLGMELTDSANVKGRSAMALLQRAVDGDLAALDQYVALGVSRRRCRDVTYSAGASALRASMPPPGEAHIALQLRGSDYERLAAKGDAALLDVLRAVPLGTGAAKAAEHLGGALAPVDPESGS